MIKKKVIRGLLKKTFDHPPPIAVLDKEVGDDFILLPDALSMRICMLKTAI
jgi:hypothetical protein